MQIIFLTDIVPCVFFNVLKRQILIKYHFGVSSRNQKRARRNKHKQFILTVFFQFF